MTGQRKMQWVGRGPDVYKMKFVGFGPREVIVEIRGGLQALCRNLDIPKRRLYLKSAV